LLPQSNTKNNPITPILLKHTLQLENVSNNISFIWKHYKLNLINDHKYHSWLTPNPTPIATSPIVTTEEIYFPQSIRKRVLHLENVCNNIPLNIKS
jgi:hypothetical protein